MNGETHQRLIRITSPQGLHMRPLQEFVKRALEFQSAVAVAKGDKRVNGKSVLELMLLGADEGSELVLEVSGSDATHALDVLAEILSEAADDRSEPPPSGGTP